MVEEPRPKPRVMGFGRKKMAHRGVNGAAMPTDEKDKGGHFFFNHPERGGYSAA